MRLEIRLFDTDTATTLFSWICKGIPIPRDNERIFIKGTQYIVKCVEYYYSNDVNICVVWVLPL
jgi:hypothetical protein